MYFSEFLETCTIRWVSFCEEGVGVGKGNPENAFFFEKFYRGHDLPHPKRSLYTPPVETTAPSTPGQTAQHRQQEQAVPDARQTTPRTDTHARTLDTLHRSALDTRQAASGRSDRVRGAGLPCNVSETEQIRTLERHTKTGLKIITFSCMFVACATLQIH